MTNRITVKQLDSRVDTLNELFGFAPEPYGARGEDGRPTTNVGTFVLDLNGSGSRLCQMVEGGGMRDLTPRNPARQTYDAISAFIAGARYMQRTLKGEG